MSIERETQLLRLFHVTGQISDHVPLSSRSIYIYYYKVKYSRPETLLGSRQEYRLLQITL